jgi:hypothetical protein
MGDESAFMSIENGNYLTLSRIGTRIWEMIGEPVTVAALCTRLSDEYDVPAGVCATEVGAFLNDLVTCRAATFSRQP